MFRSNSPADPALCPPLDSASASLQMSKFNSETVLSPVVPVHPFSLSSSSSGSKSRNFADVLTLASSVQSTQRRLTGFQAQIQCHTRSDTPTPVCVGRIIYDMLLCSASNETSRSLLEVWPSSMTTATWKLTSVESIPTPVVDPFSSLQLPALTPTISVGLPNSIELTSATINVGTTNSKYTSLHTTPPSPSLSDSYVRAHPGEVEVLDVARLDVTVGLGPSLSVWEPSPSSPQILGNVHIPGVSPNLQVPPRLVVVNPTPNLTPHPTPPASPLFTSVFTSASSASASTSHSNNHNGLGGTEGNWLTLPPNHFPNRMQDPQTHDRSRSDSVPTSAVTATDINFVSSSFSLPQPSQPPPHHQSVEEDQFLASSQSFVQDLEMSASSALVFLDETSEVEDSRKTVKDGDMWIDDVPVGSPVDDVDAQPMSKAGKSIPPMTLRLDSLSTVHSMSARKGGDEDEDSAADLEELDEGTRLMNASNTAAAAATKKKKVGIRRKVKTKSIPLKRNSLRSPTSTLSPPLPAGLHQSTSSSLTNQKQGTAVPPMARPKSNGRRSSSRSMSQSGGSSFGVGVGTNGSVSRSRSREIQGASLGMTGLTRAASGERRKPVIAVSTKLKNRPKFMLGKSKGSNSGKIVGDGSTMVRGESIGGNLGGSDVGGTEENADNERERERGRERMIAMEIIQMQRRQQLLIQQQQQQQLEMKQREDEQRALVAQLARQDADVREAEIRTQRQRLHHEQRQEQGVQRETNGLLDVSAKRPVKFNIEPNSDEGSGVGSNSKNGSEVSGTERLISLVDPIVNGIRQPHQLGIIQQQHTVAPHHHPVPRHHLAPHHHPEPHHYQQLKSEKQVERQIIREEVAERQLQKEEKGKRRDHSNPNPNTKHSTHETLNMVSSALAAKVKHTLADPLLPGQHKRTIVLTTSESEYEHSDDDGSWSSEEMGSEDEEVSFYLLRYISFYFIRMELDFSLFFIIGRAKTGATEAGSVVGSATTATASTTTPAASISCSAYTLI